MSYLHDNSLRRKQRQARKVIAGAVIGLIIVIILGWWRGSNSLLHAIATPTWKAANVVDASLQSLWAQTFTGKSELAVRNQELAREVESLRVYYDKYQELEEENTLLKETLGRVDEGRDLVFANILHKTGLTLYGTFTLDVGSSSGIKLGNKVYSEGDLLLGYIAEVTDRSSVVKLYSAPDEKVEIIIGSSNLYLEALGRGGNHYEVHLPREIEVVPGDVFVAPGSSLVLVAVVEDLIFDSRDPFQTILAATPVNPYHLQQVFVEVE
jgi:cell shape-determining protein MreC